MKAPHVAVSKGREITYRSYVSCLQQEQTALEKLPDWCSNYEDQSLRCHFLLVIMQMSQKAHRKASELDQMRGPSVSAQLRCQQRVRFPLNGRTGILSLNTRPGMQHLTENEVHGMSSIRSTYFILNVARE